MNCENENTLVERLNIFLYLLRYGIVTNLVTGRIRYVSYRPSCRCSDLMLLRHGKTVGVENKEFMSNDSDNSILSNAGIREIEIISEDVRQYKPDITLVAPLNRTLSTFRVLQEKLPFSLNSIICSTLVGINNGVWESKTVDMLDEVNYLVYYKREYHHNIFAKSLYGDSWGDVLLRCGNLLEAINQDYAGKKVLLISQGSILQGLRIILHKTVSPWSDYSSGSMFSNTGSKSIGYGKLFSILK